MLHCEVGWRETCFFLSNSGPHVPGAVYIGTGQGIIAFREGKFDVVPSKQL